MRICFLSLNSYPMLTGRNLGYAGGAEVEQAQLGRELACSGYDVYFITYNHGSDQPENIEGIKIVKTYDREKARHLNAMLKYSTICGSLRSANADIYFHEAGATGVLPAFCFLNRKKFVYRIASDAVVLGRPLSDNYGFIGRVIDTIEIKRADALVAQTEFQKRILRERFGVESVIIRNGVVIPVKGCDKLIPPIVLWVGSISSVKRPKLFLELAKCLPNVRFEMIGGKTTSEAGLFDEIKTIAQGIPNLRFRGFIPFPNINEYFGKASVFVNTSAVEGFPNTFIQAWMYSNPVVSLSVDPDGIIRKKKLGFCSGTFSRLLSDTAILVEDRKLRMSLGENALEYVNREHDIRKIASEYIRVFKQIS